MARKKRSQFDVERIKASILESALDLFNENQDLNLLSMRKIACRANCSVATIYNYYPNKDSLYIDILKNGFVLLQNFLLTGKPAVDPTNNLMEVARRYFEFAVKHKNYYQLMFSYPLPKYKDYLGTSMEMAAAQEKELAMSTLGAITRIIEQSISQGNIKCSDPLSVTKMFWAMSHGLISLYHSKVLQEVEQDAEGAYIALLNSFITCLGRE